MATTSLFCVNTSLAKALIFSILTSLNNSSRNYNVLFKDEHGTDGEARKERREMGNDLSLHNTGGDFLPAIACSFALPFHSQEYPQGSRKIRNQIDCEL